MSLWFTVGPCCSLMVLLVSHTQVRGEDTPGKGWSITLRSPWDSRLVWVNIWVLLGGPCGRAAPYPLPRSWNWNPQWKTCYCGGGLAGSYRTTTKVSNIYNNWGTLVVMSPEPRCLGAIWNQQCKYMIGGGLLWTSSEAKPSLTHSRGSWEIHPTSKQTDGMNESLFGPDCLTGVNSHMRHGETSCSEASAPRVKYDIHPRCKSPLNPVTSSQ